MQEQGKAIVAALASNLLFGVLYLYGNWMKPMSGTEVFAWRMVGMVLVLYLLVWATKRQQMLKTFIKRIGCDVKKWVAILLPTPILASQLWLFMWGPVNGYGVDVAVGYFLFPIAMVLCGRLLLGEAVSRLQWLAVSFAAAGVAHEIWQTHAFSWVTVWVFATYPIYYIARRKMGVPPLFGLLIDLSLIAPPALLYLFMQPAGMAIWHDFNRYWLLVPMLGVVSSAAMQLNLYASKAMPVTLFGMMSYCEPVLLFILAITVLGTPLGQGALITYSLIWLGLVMTLFDGWLKMRRQVAERQFLAKQRS